MSFRDKNGYYGIRITTVYSRAVCLITDATPKGFKDVDSDIHTHVEGLFYSPDGIDTLFLKQTYAPGEFVSIRPYSFSETDYAAKAKSYLATSRELRYVGRTRDSEVVIARFD